MPTAKTQRYHHGDLPNALKAAAVEVIEEKGPAGFSLREVARRAGVSHAAPAHHFRDSSGLLTAVAVDAFKLFDSAMTAAADGADGADGAGGATERLIRVGRAYAEVGSTHRAHAEVMFRLDLVNVDDPVYMEWANRAYGHLRRALEEYRDTENRDLDVDTAALCLWSVMEGLLVTYPGRVGRGAAGSATVAELAERCCRLLLHGFRPTVRPDVGTSS